MRDSGVGVGWRGVCPRALVCVCVVLVAGYLVG